MTLEHGFLPTSLEDLGVRFNNRSQGGTSKKGEEGGVVVRTTTIKNVTTGKPAGSVSITVSAAHNDSPPTLPDGTPLLTKSQKAAQDFEKAGKPTGGAKDD